MKVICATDFSDASHNALLYAALIAAQHESSLRILHVLTDTEFDAYLHDEDPSLTFEEMQTKRKKKLEELRAEVSEKFPALSCDTELLTGKFLRELQGMLGENDFTLLVMGTTGRGSEEDSFLGSYSQHAINELDIPVLIVPQNGSHGEIRKIVYASAMEPEDRAVIQQMVAFATVFQAVLRVVHLSTHESPSDEKRFEAYKEELSTFINYEHLYFDRQVIGGEIAWGLDLYVTDQRADMLVLLTKHRNFFERLFHKSVSNQLAYLTDYPIFVCKARE